MNSDNYQYINCFTPESLASSEFSNLVFSVPIYQRLFAWRREQIEKLMNDLFEAFPTESPYYLGILTVAPNTNNLDLVDGQQRMTITTLMAIAFKNIDSSMDYWDAFLNQGNRLIFSARNEDTEYLTSRAQGNIPLYVNEMMEQGIKIIKSWCENIFVTEDGNFDITKFEKFSEYVWRNLTLFCSYLPDNYISNPIELNRYFEAMNSTGRQLQHHEILLVELINEHPKSEIYSNIWTKISDFTRRYIPFNEDRQQYRREYLDMINNVQSQFDTSYVSNDKFETIEHIKPQKFDNLRPNGADSNIKLIISFEAFY